MSDKLKTTPEQWEIWASVAESGVRFSTPEKVVAVLISDLRTLQAENERLERELAEARKKIAKAKVEALREVLSFSGWDEGDIDLLNFQITERIVELEGQKGGSHGNG